MCISLNCTMSGHCGLAKSLHLNSRIIEKICYCNCKDRPSWYTLKNPIVYHMNDRHRGWTLKIKDKIVSSNVAYKDTEKGEDPINCEPLIYSLFAYCMLYNKKEL
ncbi:unnamed protein product [Caretta caretta]